MATRPAGTCPIEFFGVGFVAELAGSSWTGVVASVFVPSWQTITITLCVRGLVTLTVVRLPEVTATDFGRLGSLL